MVDNWDAITQYLINDYVYGGGGVYYTAVADNINKEPSVSPGAWKVVGGGGGGSGVSDLNALTGSLSLVGAGGISISPGVPTATDITITGGASAYAEGLSTSLTTLASPTGVGAGTPQY